MTVRQSMEVLCDAGTVYAEGMRNGIRTAISLMAKSGQTVPVSLRREFTKWEANAIHYEWRAQQGRPLPFERSEQTLALIHVFLQRAGLEPDQ